MSLHGTIRQVYLLKRLLQVYCNGANRSSYRVFTERGLRMYLAINIVGLIVFLFIGFLFSKDKKNINWKAIAIMVVINIVLAAFLIGSPVGRRGVQAAADGFVWLVDASAKGGDICFRFLVQRKEPKLHLFCIDANPHGCTNV